MCPLLYPLLLPSSRPPTPLPLTSTTLSLLVSSFSSASLLYVLLFLNLPPLPLRFHSSKLQGSSQSSTRKDPNPEPHPCRVGTESHDDPQLDTKRGGPREGDEQGRKTASPSLLLPEGAHQLDPTTTHTRREHNPLLLQVAPHHHAPFPCLFHPFPLPSRGPGKDIRTVHVFAAPW